LSGGFSDLTANGRTLYNYNDAHYYDYLGGWIEHLYLNAALPTGVEPLTTWHSRDGAYALQRVAAADEHLTALLRLYRAGLGAPLHFYPRTAWAYVCGGMSLPKAAKAWRSTRFFARGEDRHPAYRLALRGVANPLDVEFEHCATTVFGPLLEHIDDPRLA